MPKPLVPNHCRMLPDWRKLCWLPNEELAKFDIAVVNLAVALGLPDWEKIDAELCLRTLDKWAEQVRAYTAKSYHHFASKPMANGDSEAHFRVLVMVTVLQRDLGVLYNPAKVSPDAPFVTEDSFLHGVIQGNGGTCATIPVIYAAVGRRLGYPIKLVHVPVNEKGGHQFARWDEPDGERFNIEASSCGLNTPPDDYYRRGRYEMTPFVEEKGCYLWSQSPRAELAGFLMNRAHRCGDVGNHRFAVEAWALALALHPENAVTENTLRTNLNMWTRWTRERQPLGFPSIWIKPPPRRLFPDSLRVEYEQGILGLMATENLLLDPELGKVWEKMRRGEWKGKGPNRADIDFNADGSCEIGLDFKA